MGVGDTGGNFCLDEDHVYVRHGDTCFRIHQRSGKLEGQFTTPVAADQGNRAWGYIACRDGVLYGSVGPREIAAALRDEGHDVEVAAVSLHTTIRRLDNVTVEVRLAEDIIAEVKVWVVRSKGTELDDQDGEEAADSKHDRDAGREAGADGNSPDN